MNYLEAQIVRLNEDPYPCTKDNRVTIPFGEEYAVWVKNNGSSRIKFQIFIDGESISNGIKYVLGTGEEMVVERFLEDCLDTGRKLQWLPRDHKEGKGKEDEPEAGIVRIVAQQEKSCWAFKYDYNSYRYYWSPKKPEVDPYSWPVCYLSDAAAPISAGNTLTSSGASVSAFCASNGAKIVEDASGFEAEGITGRGGHSGQKFSYSYYFDTDPDTEKTIMFFLVPPKSQHRVPQSNSVTYDAYYCPSCGRKRKSRKDNFCPNCGTKY